MFNKIKSWCSKTKKPQPGETVRETALQNATDDFIQQQQNPLAFAQPALGTQVPASILGASQTPIGGMFGSCAHTTNGTYSNVYVGYGPSTNSFKGDLTEEDYISFTHKNEDGSFTRMDITVHDWIEGVAKISRGIKLKNYEKEQNGEH